MRIAIDARELIGTPTGVGRYLGQLLAAWSALPDARAHEFILCAPEAPEAPDARGLRLTTMTAPGQGTVWQQFALPRLLRASAADVLLAPAYMGPLLTGVPTVLSVHDVSFAAHPEWFGWREGWRLRVGARLSAHKAARVLTLSEFSKREIVCQLGIGPDKIEVIYPGVTSFSRAGGQRGVPAVDERLVLHVGTLFTRRHIPEIISGFSRLAVRHPETRLEIVGQNRTRPYLELGDMAAASPAAAQIDLHAWVPDDRLASLYRRASAFIFLSDYEGFALTPVEALASGVPVILLDTEVAREIYGPAACYVERPDPGLIEAALERVLFDPGERTRLLSAAAAVIERYSWEDCARRTLQALISSAS